MKPIQVIVLLHPGFEEMEAVAPIDLLSRAGVEVSQVSLSQNKLVRGRSGIVIQAEHTFDEINATHQYDAVILPGGPGIKKMRKQHELCVFLKEHHADGKILACICAAPLLLLDAGLLPNHYTAHPSTAEELPHAEKQEYVRDGHILTSSGAGTATDFGLALVEALTGSATRIEVAQSICWPKR